MRMRDIEDTYEMGLGGSVVVVVAALAAVYGLLLLLFKHSAKSFVAPEERLIISPYLVTRLQ